MININLIKKADFSGFTFLEGFPGIGLVGPMSISYLVNKLGFDYIGYLESDAIPSLVSIHDNQPQPPLRLYLSKKYKLLVLFSEVSLPPNINVYGISRDIYDFLKKGGVSRIISIGGFPAENPEGAGILGIASSPELAKSFDKLGIKGVGEGVATGFSALLLLYASRDGIDDLNLIVPVNPNMIDPRYAEIAIEALNKITGTDVDVSELDKEAAIVEQKIKVILKKSKEDAQYQKGESGPSMYA